MCTYCPKSALPPSGQHGRADGILSEQRFYFHCLYGPAGVIKTRPGYASSLASDIDMREFPFLVGSIAGDDTIMLALAEGTSREYVKMALSDVIPGMKASLRQAK